MDGTRTYSSPTFPFASVAGEIVMIGQTASIGYVRVPVQPFASVAVTITGMRPSSNGKIVWGSKVYGSVPPSAMNPVRSYSSPTVAGPKVAGAVMVITGHGAPSIVISYAALLSQPRASRAVTVKW